MPANSWKLAPGLNNVGSYQVSGKPYASGGCEAPRSSSTTTRCLVVRFPTVTNWFQIIPSHRATGQEMRVAFSQLGLYDGVNPEGNNYFTVNMSSSLGPFHVKTSELWFMEHSNVAPYTFDIVAGLTNIPASRTSINEDRVIEGVTRAAGPNWTGSLGVG